MSALVDKVIATVKKVWVGLHKVSVVRALRTLVQFTAAGGLTALVTVLAGHLTPAMTVVVLGAFHIFVTFCQNYMEGKGWIPSLFSSLLPVSAKTEK